LQADTTLSTDTDAAKLAALEAEIDPEMHFRQLRSGTALVVGGLLLTLSAFHYYTAGFGLLRETTHRGVHLSFVLGLIFLVFSWRKRDGETVRASTWLRPGGIALVDWIAAIAVAAASLYVPWIFEDLAFRVGNPTTLDVVMGSLAII
ncbi:hypothetical protein J8J40_22370, partial [Mycobacterium tuberculosis]|nr:hypothetical protein [Mycobacterium tuberculosis]